MSTTQNNGRVDYFELGKRLMAPSATEEAVHAAHQAAIDAVVNDGSARLRAVDAIALGEAAYLAGQAYGRELLRYLNEFNAAAVCCDDLDHELAALLGMVRQPFVPLPVVDVRLEDFGPVGPSDEPAAF